MPVTVQVPTWSTGLELELHRPEETIRTTTLPWPEDFKAVLDSGLACSGLTTIDIDISAHAVTDLAKAIAVNGSLSECSH